MIDKKLIYAIIWASNNQEKYWFKVFQDLLNAWYQVIPINPNEKEILWKKCYKKLSECQSNIDVVIFVTQPQVSLEVLKEVNELKIKNARFQPWSESPDAINFCKLNWINYTVNACIMIEKSKNKNFQKGGH